MSLPVFKTFGTTAERIAWDFDANDKGALVDDLETGNLYHVIRSGAGANTCVPIASEFGEINFRLRDFHKIDSSGDVGNLADTGGGQLASDSTPTFIGNAAETGIITWVANGVEMIAISTSLPTDLDDSRDVYVDLITSSGGTSNAATLTVQTGWDGGALVSDTATGAASTTPAAAIATVAAADVPASPSYLTIHLTPAAHATDTMILWRARLRYYRV